MGTEFHLIRRHDRTTYDLGKPRFGIPDGLPLPKSHETYGLLRRLFGAPGYETIARSTTDAAFSALWSIMGHPNFRRFVLTPADRERIADALHRGSDAIPDAATALLAADAVIAWAGDAEIVLSPDRNVECLAHLGFDADIDRYRETGSIHATVADITKDRT